MASTYSCDNIEQCWKNLWYVLENKFWQYYILTSSYDYGQRYRDISSKLYLLDDIQFALLEEKLPAVELHLRGLEESGNGSDDWIFTFTKEGLVKSYHYYNMD